jgi:hypothetical protein
MPLASALMGIIILSHPEYKFDVPATAVFFASRVFRGFFPEIHDLTQNQLFTVHFIYLNAKWINGNGEAA